jgi:hypothetical protein
MSDEPTSFQNTAKPLFEEYRAKFLADARYAARMIAQQNGEVTIDDVREVCPPPPEIDGRVMGAVLKHRDFEIVGSCRSTRGTCHHRPIQVFALKE